ncbi:uncharacterized protein LOC117407842 isoform X1 [Acipenser ruthenus]|uniref:uncharacterized protein LOC117407842 isoform X1 n=1 Tax=Acipenser ruthenus TaxID=7906 RepID=UPI00145B41F8|nr:uncharacterized protein LOC117407842 isoform X1 [Acipenser ruthenus]
MSTYQDGPKAKRASHSTVEQLTGDKCREAISVLQHSTDESLVKEKMRATFKHRQNIVQDPEKSSTILGVFPRFLDIPGLIDQDFTMLFGEDASGKFLAKWPTLFRPGSSQTARTYPPVPIWKPSSLLRSTTLMIWVGTSMVTFLAQVGREQPFLLCVGEQKNIIQKFYIVVDQKAIPCKTQTSEAAFDELFKAHYVFGVSCDEALGSFYTFIQTTVYNIDVGNAKESPRVKEIRARLLNRDT